MVGSLSEVLLGSPVSEDKDPLYLVITDLKRVHGLCRYCYCCGGGDIL